MAVHFVQAYGRCITLPAQHMELVGFISFIGIQNKAWGGGWRQQKKKKETFQPGPEIDTLPTRQVKAQTQTETADIYTPAQLKTHCIHHSCPFPE